MQACNGTALLFLNLLAWNIARYRDVVINIAAGMLALKPRNRCSILCRGKNIFSLVRNVHTAYEVRRVFYPVRMSVSKRDELEADRSSTRSA